MILEEWARATVKLGPEAEVFASGEIATLTAQFPRASVTPDNGMLRRLWLPDEDDIHVLAAAVTGHCDAILTMNAKDFPGNLLAYEDLFRADPDGFCCACTTRPRRLSAESPTKSLPKRTVCHQSRGQSAP